MARGHLQLQERAFDFVAGNANLTTPNVTCTVVKGLPDVQLQVTFRRCTIGVILTEEQSYEISSEEQALQFLEMALLGKIGEKPVKIEFKNWPIIEIKLVGDGYNSTITPDIAEALVEIQHAMNRAYARFVHGSSNARSLTNEERQDIKFKAKVEKGSSLIKVDLGEFGTAITNALVGKMDSTQLMISVLGIALIGGGTLAARAYLKYKSEDKKLDAESKKLVALSVEETKRLEIVARALTVQPRLQHTQEDFDEARREILRSAGDAKTLALNGVELPNALARQIASTPRATSKDIQLNGSYVIQKIDWQQEGDVRLSLTSTDQQVTFTASLSQDSITTFHREMLKTAEWDRKTIYMSINATELRGDITTARIVSVDWPENKAK